MKQLTKKQLLKREKRRINRENKLKHKEWVKVVMTRDGYMCSISKRQFGIHGLHVHHILPNTKKYGDLRFDINNGITLSSYYHKFGPDSAHTNCLFLSNWLKENRPAQYEYLLQKMKELNDNSDSKINNNI